MSGSTASEKRKAFRQLHQSGCFVIPNPWDAGSARMLASMGFKALATTSSGYAWSNGKPDGGLPRDEVLAHMRFMVEAVDLPVNADFESGFADTAAGVEESVLLAIETGVAGFSLEDATGNPQSPLMDIEEAARRISVARAAIDKAGGDTLLVGRAENFFVGVPDLDDAIARLKAYSEAGADCLYAPAIKTAEQVKAVVQAVTPKPVNVLIGWDTELTVKDLAQLGVRRISVGGALARAAWTGFYQAARGIAEEGKFAFGSGGPTGKELNSLFK
ncbi:isocitrate lyase/PEP mutase family protein [Pusillimonas noertemannii]|uniref:2-methylisocitrate lyase-like PEP mutase family enzyme n=1 Tax=Pusillimonas noertemannii TaxID=305977 RepID=A0A2U1CMQ5_9BURK|nr:isocitrate lyase/phosphoenolpyruvate mutase family protein [Pusillimonas noertemannii]NYT68689.1 isocitrate lyase/phosphoenolpyruvate mutase family protein [Pusillimonas noertemannii]PVY62293.1 2-methylisocitrate lyase-like PEP mutase family enzyme [Pusillimonas noertemannii]TFL10731.1 isocitrate lyase/phosphoenolpyruvate mutase family protein [Pusillimonas noertemannii]